jgi:hypothetical protein
MRKKKIAFISCQMNIEEWQMLTLALIGRRSLNYEKEDMEMNERPDRRNRILVFYHFSKGGVESHLLVGSSIPDTI